MGLWEFQHLLGAELRHLRVVLPDHPIESIEDGLHKVIDIDPAFASDIEFQRDLEVVVGIDEYAGIEMPEGPGYLPFGNERFVGGVGAWARGSTSGDSRALFRHGLTRELKLQSRTSRHSTTTRGKPTSRPPVTLRGCSLVQVPADQWALSLLSLVCTGASR
jgi:hypothetical protein